MSRKHNIKYIREFLDGNYEESKKAEEVKPKPVEEKEKKEEEDDIVSIEYYYIY